MSLRGGDRRSPARHSGAKLAELGLDANESTRWQRVADVPEKLFEQFIAVRLRDGEPITSSALLRLHRAWKRREAEEKRR